MKNVAPPGSGSDPVWKGRLRSRETSLAVIAALIGIAATFAPMTSWLASFLASEESRIADRIHLSGRLSPPADDIVVLGIDDASLALDSLFPEDLQESPALQLMSKGWPWSREVWALAIRRLVEAGARSVVLDLTFGTPSTPEADAALRDVLTRYPDRIVLGADHQWRELGSSGQSQDVVMPTFEILPAGNQRQASIGLLNFWPDPDEIVRTQRPEWTRASTDRSDAMPSLALAVLRQQGGHVETHRPDEERAFRFCHPSAFAPLSFHEIFVTPVWQSNFENGAFFAGKTVFVGATARHFQDEVQTPVGRLQGVQAHAHALNALRGGFWLTEAPAAVRLAVLWSAVLLAWALVTWLRRPLVTLCILVAGSFAALAIQSLAFNHASLLLPMLLPLLGWNVTGLYCLGYDFVLERRRRRDLMRYFSPDMAEELARNPAPYLRSLSGVNRVITLLFSDLRGFTSLSEIQPPEALLAQLNQYLDRMVEVVFATRGSIGKFIGDAVMAVWGRVRAVSDPAKLAQDAADGIEAALRMREELAKLNERWQQNGLPALHVGIGLHQGEAIVGNIGSNMRMEFTAIGDSVNSAARLESLTKQYGVDILVSQVLHDHGPEKFLFRRVDLVQAKGKTKPIEVFTVLGRAASAAPAGLDHYERAMTDYRSGNFTSALHLFAQAADAGLNDTLTALYRQRCQNLIDNPPPAPWNGVFVATNK
jgi:adenylate cyclase